MSKQKQIAIALITTVWLSLMVITVFITHWAVNLVVNVSFWWVSLAYVILFLINVYRYGKKVGKNREKIREFHQKQPERTAENHQRTRKIDEGNVDFADG